MRFKRLFVYFLVSLGCLFVLPAAAFAKTDCPDEDKVCTGEGDEELCFCFDDDDKVDPPSKNVKRTFSMPSIKAGFVFDFHNEDLLPHFAIEMFSVGDLSADFGVAQSRAFFSLNWELIPIIKLGPSVWAGYNIKENDPAYGFGLSILSF